MIFDPEKNFSDPALPHLRTVLNSREMQGVFTSALHLKAGIQITNCRIARVKYRPRKNCIITYNLDFTGSERCLLTVLTGRQGAGQVIFPSAKKNEIPVEQCDTGVFYLAEYETVGWIFPNDRKLSGLALLIDEEHLKNSILPEILERQDIQAGKISEVKTELVQYVAERACTVRVVAQTDHTPVAFYGKTYCLDEAENAWEIQQRLWHSENRRSGKLSIPKPLLYQSESKTIWQSELPGESFTSHRIGNSIDSGFFELAAEAVAVLHQTPIQISSRQTTASIIEKLATASDVIAYTLPPCAKAVKTVCERLSGSAGKIPESPIATLHGDLNLKNFLVDKNRVSLIDFDNVCLGHPLQDLGSFLANLYYRSLIENQLEINVDWAAAAFISSYQKKSGIDWDSTALEWHLAAALIYERAYRCITRLKCIQSESMDKLISLADELSLQISIMR